MGLGQFPTIGLSDARKLALEARQLRARGIDPIDARDAERAEKAAAAAARLVTFKEVARAYMEAKRPGWRSGKHSDQWENTLSTYCYPMLGALPVQAIDTALVLKVLQPIWTEKPTMAGRLRG